MAIKIKVTGIDETIQELNDLEQQVIQTAANQIYTTIKEKVPEIENEKDLFAVKYDGKSVSADISNLSAGLQDKINAAGFEL